jgi:hypothetical protein
MKQALNHYDVFPRVVPVGREVTVTIHPKAAHAALPDPQYFLTILPLTESIENYGEAYPTLTLVPQGGDLVFHYTFAKEQEYYLRVAPWPGGGQPVLFELSVYAVEDDLFCRRPYRLDLHVHSCYSDGKECPEFVAAQYRKAGFDGLALTDHERYYPSRLLQEYYADVPIDLALYAGEEVHAPGNHIHLVNFGGDFSVNERYQEQPQAYEAAARCLGEGLAETVPAERFEYGSCKWVCDRIREGGGLAIFAHPHWLANVYHVRDRMTARLLRDGVADAFELIGGQSLAENEMQVAFYEDCLAQGRRIPVVGSSDAHTTIDAPHFTHMMTLAFAPSLARDDVVAAIREGYSLAATRYPGEGVHLHGAYRLASYGRFLLDNYFPHHDDLCFEEGLQMLAHVAGDPEARGALSRLSGRTEAYRQRCFGG